MYVVPQSSVLPKETLDLRVLENLPLIAGIFAGLFTFFAVAHLALLPTALAPTMSAVAAATAGVLALLRAWLRRATVPPAAANPIGAAIAGLVLLNAALHLYLSANPLQTTNLMLLVIGSGCIFLSMRWLSLVVAATGAAWMAAAWASAQVPGFDLETWTHFGMALLSASTAALVIALVRIKSLTTLERERLAASQLAVELAAALDAVQWSEAELTDAQRIAQVGSWIWDLESNRFAVSPELRRIFGGGLDGAAPTWEALLSAVHPDDRATLARAVDAAMHRGLPFAWEFRILRPDGGIRTVQGSGRVMPARTGGRRLVGTIQDITFRRAAEQALIDSEESYRRVVETVEDVIFTAQPDGALASLNPAFERLTGWRGNDWIGQPVTLLVHPDDAPGLAECIREAGEGRLAPSRESRLRTQAGTHRMGEFRVRPLMRGSQVTGILGMVRDVTDRRRMEEELRQSEARWRSLVESAPGAVALIARDATIVYVNHAANPPAGSVLGRNALEFAPPSYRTQAAAAIDAVFERGETQVLPPMPYRLPDGRTLWHQSRIGAVRSGGTVNAAIVFTSDVTLQKQAEEAVRESEARFRALIESAPGAIVLANRRGTLVFANRAAEELFDLDAGRLDDVRFETLLADRARDRVRVEWPDYFEGRLSRADVPGRRRGGGEVPLEVTFNAVTTGQGPLLIAVLRDTTAQQQMLHEIMSARDAAVASAAAKTQFLANMSHEIRTPLNAVVGISGLLLDGPLDAEQREYVEILRSSARALVGIVNDILDFSKIEAGQLAFEPADFDPRQLVTGVTVLLGEEAARKRLAVETYVDSDVPALLRGDAGRIAQALTNLVSNAVKFTAQGRVTVRLSRDDTPGLPHWYRFTVSDTGIGVPADRHARLFKPFSQADGSTSRQFGGTGLGLAISKQLIELMGGRIGFTSRPGDGSTFWFVLELAPADAAGRDAAPAARPVPLMRPLTAGVRTPTSDAARDTPGAPARLLIAEDNAVNRHVLVRQLEKLGYSADVVSSGIEALTATAMANYDLIFMDCQMPDMDGYEATAAIRDREAGGPARVPIVAVTAHAREADRQRCLETGMDDYISKPIDEAELARVLHQWLPEDKRAVDAEFVPPFPQS